VFRGVTGATYHKETDTLQIHTTQLRYEHVFEHLDLKMETDHFESEAEELSDDAGQTAAEELQLPQPEEETAVEAEGRGMQKQESRWKKAKKWAKRKADAAKKAAKKKLEAARRLVEKSKKIVTNVVNTVQEKARSVKEILSGTYKVSKSWKLKSLNYNRDVSKKFDKWNFNGAVKLAASANGEPTLVFNLKIEKLKVSLAELYFNVKYKGGIRVQFASNAAYDNKARKSVSLINLQSMTFTIGAIPMSMSITCPINAGYDIDVDGRVRFNFLLAASGYVRLGARYTNSRGFQVINSQKLDKTRDFSPRYYRYQVGLQAFVTIQFKASVNFLGFMSSAMDLSTEATLQSNSKCKMLLQMNLQPIITAQYSLQVTVAGRKIISKDFGPKVLVSWKKPVMNYCIPKRRGSCPRGYRYSRWTRKCYRRSRSAHGMMIQTESSETEPINSPDGVQITKPEDIEDNSTGTTWFGGSDCSAGGALEKSLTFSMQFLTGDYESDDGNSSTQIILTLSHNASQSTEQGDYRMTNLQRTYAMNDSIALGFKGNMTLLEEEDKDMQYSASVNDTADPVLTDKFFRIQVDEEDATKIFVSADTMFCTTNFIELAAAQYNDDNSTFTVFASGESTEEHILLQKLKAYAIYVPVLCVIVLAIVAIVVVVQKKKAQAVHGAEWAKSQHDLEPIMAQEPAAAAPTGFSVNSVAHAPAPTQDSRVSDL
jgi:vacuolar-type H+-ATPase subunit E/Vma4